MRHRVCVLLLCLGLSREAIAQADPETGDLVRVAEAFRLAEALRTAVWPGWETTSFSVLLVSGDREFLIGRRKVPKGFSLSGYSTLLQADVWTRPRQFDPGLLATFPAFGLPPVVVIGRAEATGKTSTDWVLTLLHEHFHQHQSSAAGYYAEVEQLGLSGGDQTGRWMLDYPFPYESTKVASAFASVARELGQTLGSSSPEARSRFWRMYSRFLDSLSPRDRRYLSFQVWQEGVPRYVELQLAELAAQRYAPSLEFRRLPEVDPFARVAERIRAAIFNELSKPDLAGRKRESFYAFGAGLALLLDRDREGWKSRYMTEKFSLTRDPA